MTHRTREISLLLLVVAALVVSGPAAAPPPVPMRVSGTAFDAGGSPLPVGTTILGTKARIRGDSNSHWWMMSTLVLTIPVVAMLVLA